MSLTSIKIQALLRDMDGSMRKYRNLKETNFAEYRAKIEAENMTLVEELYAVFEKHLRGELDETFFNMLKMKRQIELGKITEEQASKIVGQQLFDRYCAPLVNNLPPAAPTLTYEQYYNQFNETKNTESS